MSYENLMRPIRIQNMTLRNRVMMAPMGTNLANPDGSISEEHKNYNAYRLNAASHNILRKSDLLDR